VRLEDFPALAVIQLHPVVLSILNLSGALECLGEELTQVVVVGSVFETEIADIAEVLVELLWVLLAGAEAENCGKHTREAIAQVLDGGGLLLLSNLLVLLLVGGSLETLPWQSTAQEVHENMTQRLEIVTTRLLASQMGVDAHVSSGTGQGLAFPVGDVLLRLGIAVLLGHAEVDDVDDIGALSARAADEEVVGLDVAVDEILLVDGLHP
jgi:hypothetical protein